MSSAIDLVVHLTRMRDGTRRVTHVSEVQHMEGDVIIMQDLFMFDFSMGVDEDGQPTGARSSRWVSGPHFADKLEDAGLTARPRTLRRRRRSPACGWPAMKFLIALLVLPAAGLLAWGVITWCWRERQRGT